MVENLDELFGKSGLSATQKKCAELIVMKDINKMNMNDIAEEIGVNRSTIFRWKQNKEFNDYIEAMWGGRIRNRTVLYLGEDDSVMVNGMEIRYQNMNQFLKA